MEKEIYEEVKCEVIYFDSEDIITSSYGVDVGEGKLPLSGSSKLRG